MPWTVSEDTHVCPASKPWAVKNQQTGDLRGCHPTENHARRQQRALYAIVPDANAMTLLTQSHAWERGDTIYLCTPVTRTSPSEQQVEEFAFASTVKRMAPNENFGWLQGRYVEGGKANLNNAMWLSDELALKALTPALCPVTVMHDPRTAVGTIADVKLFDEERSRIETILAIWRHRFPDTWEEIEANIDGGTLMQSMECQAPWYACSDCGQSFIKLAEGKEQAGWCDHLRSNSSCRILGDVCFTGTGLIFGTRGGQGAYTEAYLDHFREEIAEFHDRAHVDGHYKPREEPTKMGFVQIDEAELAALRSDRDKARDEVAEVRRDLTTKVEKAEADTTREKERADGAERERDELKAAAQSGELKSRRWDALGTGFVAKLGEVTKGNLQASAANLSDEDWDARLKEVEELTGVKRDAKAEGSSEGSNGGGEGASFSEEEMARFKNQGVTNPAGPSSNGDAARSLARALKPSRPKPEPVK